jgi:hypothetical protein
MNRSYLGKKFNRKSYDVSRPKFGRAFFLLEEEGDCPEV